MSGQMRSASAQFSSRFFFESPPNEGVHEWDAHLAARLDDELDVRDCRAADFRIRVERVRVEAEA